VIELFCSATLRVEDIPALVLRTRFSGRAPVLFATGVPQYKQNLAFGGSSALHFVQYDIFLSSSQMMILSEIIFIRKEYHTS
jgi:hypothetical protein